MFRSHCRRFMISLAIASLAFNVLTIPATQCNNGQQCRDCDNEGDCSTLCYPGFFGKKCRSVCSIGCKNQLCELADNGIDKCMDGCVPGFKGTSCTIPCGNPRTQCTECEGGCDGGYCMSSSSCVSGCVDSYYGLDCKSCSERCKSCSRSTGMCDDCHDPYKGLNCEISCENCAGSCESGCEGGCKPGFYGHWCDKVCSENCRSGPDTDAVSVLECDRNTSIICIPECDNITGDCTFGCNKGWYGNNCSSRCNPKCAHMSCTESGACADGCVPGYAGTDCSCYENCFDHVCHPSSGICAKGCINGYYGGYCNNTCVICLDGKCDGKFGTCIRGCNITDRRCKSTCTHDCSIDACLTYISCEAGDRPEVDMRYIIIGLSTVLSVSGILCAFCFGKCWSKRRNVEADNYTVEYQPPSHRYWEIRDADVNQECDSPENDSNNVIPALEEQLQEAQYSGTHYDLIPDNTSGDNASYTHLVRDVFVDDQTARIKYITPAEEKGCRVNSNLI